MNRLPSIGRRDYGRLMGGPTESSGQALPLFALMLVVLLGFAALAIDVTRVYADLRFYRATADSAALAGAQELRADTSRTPTAGDQQDAREVALASLEQQLGGTRNGPGCDPTTGDIADCALDGSPYHVWVTTPSPSCVSCVKNRSVQVTVEHPDYGLTFARVFGQDEWDPQATSVAGLAYGRSYAIMTLRPPDNLGGPAFDVKDIWLKGGSDVRVSRGDVGSNANMEYDGASSGVLMHIAPDYGMYYYDWVNPGPLWYPLEPFPPTPTVMQLQDPIEDPNYRYPAMSGSRGSQNWDDARTSQAGPTAAVQRASDDPGCEAEADKLRPIYSFMATQDLADVYCFNPGTYESGKSPMDAKITIGTGEVGILKPGAYYLKSGLDVGSGPPETGGRLIGGYESGQPGVALMFDPCNNKCIFSGNAARIISLNAGTKWPPGSPGTAATAAIDWDNQRVETSGPASPSSPLLISILVLKDPECYVPTGTNVVEPAKCDDTSRTINIAGGGSLALEGVQYMPTDNVMITGGSSGYGQVGQIISWTLFYAGGTHINQEGPPEEGPGVLRIDAACSPTESCTYP